MPNKRTLKFHIYFFLACITLLIGCTADSSYESANNKTQVEIFEDDVVDSEKLETKIDTFHYDTSFIVIPPENLACNQLAGWVGGKNNHLSSSFVNKLIQEDSVSPSLKVYAFLILDEFVYESFNTGEISDDSLFTFIKSYEAFCAELFQKQPQLFTVRSHASYALLESQDNIIFDGTDKKQLNAEMLIEAIRQSFLAEIPNFASYSFPELSDVISQQDTSRQKALYHEIDSFLYQVFSKINSKGIEKDFIVTTAKYYSSKSDFKPRDFNKWLDICLQLYTQAASDCEDSELAYLFSEIVWYADFFKEIDFEKSTVLLEDWTENASRIRTNHSIKLYWGNYHASANLRMGNPTAHYNIINNLRENISGQDVPYPNDFWHLFKGLNNQQDRYTHAIVTESLFFETGNYYSYGQMMRTLVGGLSNDYQFDKGRTMAKRQILLIDSILETKILDSTRIMVNRLALSNELSLTYLKEGSDSAIHYARDAVHFAENHYYDNYYLKWNLHKSYIYLALSLIDNHIKYDSALYFLNKSIQLENRDHFLKKVETTLQISRLQTYVYIRQNEPDSATKYFNQTNQQYPEDYKDPKYYRLAAEYYALNQEFDSAYIYLHLADSLSKKNRQSTGNKTISDSMIKGEQLKRKLESKQESQKRILLYFGLGLSLLVGGFIFNRLRLTNKQKRIIKQQKDEVETAHEQLTEKNREITDSIAYAKRIQSAILPPIKLVKEYLPSSFVLYKPKDVVAGDFYWMLPKANDGATLFAAADCTGHGVPGAMVSVVCNSALNRSVKEFGLSEPGEILTKTRELVIEEFEKSDEEVKDGMDVAFCSLQGTTIKYAGAHNPLYIIRKGSNEVEEIKANKQPIGKFDELLPYTTHTVELNKGDSIYLFSDGYVDQFGGEKGKKFKAPNLRKLLLSIQDQNMEQQHQLLDEAFESWKGTLEQIDDVCMIGVRI